MLYMYSEEKVFTDLYNTLTLNNGSKARLVNINRSNNKNKIYFKFNLTGRLYINIYRGYFDENRVLNYELSNKQLVTGTGVDETMYFQDFTSLDRHYTNYYIELEPIEPITIEPIETGLYFDSLETPRGFTNVFQTNLVNDINGYPLMKQDHEKVISFNVIVNRGYLQQLINVVEKPFYLIWEDNCINNSTKLLANRNINTNYVTSHSKYIDVSLTNVEQI